jgi:acetyl-CoA carboxylase carboxyl transferase subunit alpha
MLQYSTYSVISPEGCAYILWKKAEAAEVAAETLGITANDLKKLGLTDNIIQEPLGGAHRDFKTTMNNVKYSIKKELNKFKEEPIDLLLNNRYIRLMNFGQTKESEK